MDLLDFENPELYFDADLPPGVAELIETASQGYGTLKAERALAQAEALAPECLDVLVAVFRYHYYQHDLARARKAGFSAVRTVADKLAVQNPLQLDRERYEQAFRRNAGAARFLLQALKGIGYLSLRLGDISTGKAYLRQVVELDEHDRMGCRVLLELADTAHPPGLQSGSTSNPRSEAP